MSNFIINDIQTEIDNACNLSIVELRKYTKELIENIYEYTRKLINETPPYFIVSEDIFNRYNIRKLSIYTIALERLEKYHSKYDIKCIKEKILKKYQETFMEKESYDN